MRRGAIDLGSNSILLLVSDDGEILHDEARVVGLGKGLGDRGDFLEDRMAFAVKVLSDYTRCAVDFGLSPEEIQVVATSAARRATNLEAFSCRVRSETGLQIRLLSGNDEARLSWWGAQGGLDLPQGPRLVIDPGGGSTEVILGSEEGMETRFSLEVGSARLTEQFLGFNRVDPANADRLARHVETLIAAHPLPYTPLSAVTVAGTATTLAAMDAGLLAYDGDIVHGYRLTRRALVETAQKLLVATPEERQHLAAVSPQRADFLLAGAILIERILAACGLTETLVSDRGLRYGVIQEGVKRDSA